MQIRRAPKPNEEGFVLLAVICMLALLIIMLSIAIPRMRKEIQRDREVETMQRGKQYIRAIKLYYKKFSSYPPSADALTKSSEIRFLRRKYTDPTTGKDEWKPIQFGQNKAPTAMGFFGQPLIGGSTMAGTGPNGDNPITGSSTAGTVPNPSTGAAPVAGTDPGSTTGSPIIPIGAGGNLGISGPTFGGAGIIGFSPGSPKQSILVYKKKNHYNEWEFVYDPLAERGAIPGQGPGGPPLQPGAPSVPLPMPGTAPTAPTTPTAPTSPMQ
jgi:type II secretory pathway pseudopilin PulG